MGNIIQIPKGGQSFEENFERYGLETFRHEHPGVILLLKGDKEFYCFGKDREAVEEVIALDCLKNQDLADTILSLKGKGHKVGVINKHARRNDMLKMDDQQNPGDMEPKVFEQHLAAVSPEVEAEAVPVESEANEIAVVGEGITGRKLMEIHQKSRDLIAEGVSFGMKRNIWTSVGLWNIKQHETYKVEGFKSWSEYCDAIGMDRKASYKYLQIAATLHQAFQNKGLLGNPDTFAFQKVDLEKHCKHGLEYLKTLPLNELNSLSKDLGTFEQALLGDGSEQHKQFTQLLLEAPKNEKDQKDEAAKLTDEQEFHKYMREVCKTNGWKWDAKNRQCVAKDGSPLTQEQLSQIETPDSALRVWQQLVEREVTNFERRVAEIIKVHGPNYVRYQFIPNDAVSESVNGMRDRFSKVMTQIEMMVDNLHAGELERVEELHRRGLEEAV